MSLKGLTKAEVKEQRKRYGENILPEPKLKTPLDFFMETFQDKLNLILLVMLIVFSILVASGHGSITEPLGIALVLLTVSIIGVHTGMKSQKSAKELRDKTGVRYCNVIRDGHVIRINANELVVGDVVTLLSGEAIHGDGYLIEGEIKVDNSVINGESEECPKQVVEGYVYQQGRKITGADYVDANSLFAGTIITEGEGKMVVTEVGSSTVNGSTVLSLQSLKENKTSLEMQLEELAGQISRFGYRGAIVTAIALFLSLVLEVGFTKYFQGDTMKIVQDLLFILVTALTIIVAAVPEGLPLIINLIVSQNAKVMLKNNILAKHVNKIPEAGNIQLLCTDKTGTLTQGVLVPVKVVKGNGEEIKNESAVADQFQRNIILNSSAMFEKSGKIIGGNATERALLTLVSKDMFQKEVNEGGIIEKLPFNSTNKFSAVEVQRDEKRIVYYKGAPERLLEHAVAYLEEDGEHPIDKKQVMRVIKEFTTKAMRVIATAYSEEPLGEEIGKNLVLTSLVAIRDDVRKEVPKAVKSMHQAGVQVMMMTGDVIDTARAIAQDAGLITKESDLVMSAEEVDNMSDQELKEKLTDIKVIARATPQTKLRVVRLGQEMKLCVGMTGDGTNDAPALKAADVGFSMGSGTDVCKDAGDIIITDDNFVSITASVLLGRTFMQNVMKFLKFQLPINFTMVILSVLYPLLNKTEALAAVQILIINIVIDGLNSLAFGGEPSKEEYMQVPPVPKGSKLLSKEIMEQILVSAITFIVIFLITLLPRVKGVFGTPETYLAARFALLIIMATINGFNIRTDKRNLFQGMKKNKLFLGVAVIIFAGIFALVQMGGSYVHSVPLNLKQWLVVVALAGFIIPVDLCRKALKERKQRQQRITKSNQILGDN